MALLSAIFTALSRKVGDLISALVGWSVGALFGQLSSRGRMMVSASLLLSLFWPVFIIGVPFPGVATYLFAFVPLKNPMVHNILRMVWIVLALIAPMIVGLMIRSVVPKARNRSVWSSMVHGYPMALGFAISFLITVFTVPLVKLTSMARRWTDEHMYVQPLEGRYDDAVRDLCEACVWAGLEPRAVPVPGPMALSTRVIKFFAGSTIEGLIAEHPKMVRAANLELYLYPADLLLRGDKHTLARVRAMVPRTRLDRDALMVQGEQAQRLQKQLAELWMAIDRHESVDELGAALPNRLKTISEDSTKPGISWDEWVTLDGIARRIEMVLFDNDSVLDQVGAAKAEAIVKRKEAVEPQVKVQRAVRDSEHASTADLVSAALFEAKELVRLEVAMAKVEAKREIKAGIAAASMFAVAAVFVLTMLSVLAVTLVLFLGGEPLHGLIVAGGCLAVGLVAGVVGYGKLPTHPMQRTRDHLQLDVNHLKEHLA